MYPDKKIKKNKGVPSIKIYNKYMFTLNSFAFKLIKYFWTPRCGVRIMTQIVY